MKSCVSGKLPAGITDNHVEFFAQDSQVFAFINGELLHIQQWPREIKDVILADIEKHPKALACLVEADIVEEDEMISQYIRCRYSALDNDPDMINGKLQASEYVDCQLRGTCPYEGRLCDLLKAPYGTLTKREIEVLRLIPEGLLDKEIGDQLGISILTVGVYMKNLREKTGCKNKAELVRFAYLKNLI
ncbi:LuxR C-terminal-related transcriptional regulator [Mongoliitalea lutea]|nr:LuxR family transcriptional regulator [Mongoliitalea lutea]